MSALTDLQASVTALSAASDAVVAKVADLRSNTSVATDVELVQIKDAIDAVLAKLQAI